MLYFPSKLKCQLILMWKRKVPNTQCTDTQTAFTLPDTSLVISNPALPSRYQLMESCAQVMEGCVSLIRPNVMSNSICLVKAISKFRCSCGLLLSKEAKKSFYRNEVNPCGLGKLNRFVPQMTAGVSLFVLLYLVGINGNSGKER